MTTLAPTIALTRRHLLLAAGAATGSALQPAWARQATELVQWSRPWDTVLEWDLPYARWFVGGQLNVSENCLDRHVAAGLGDRVAYHWEGEPGDTRSITYADLCSHSAGSRP